MTSVFVHAVLFCHRFTATSWMC